MILIFYLLACIIMVIGKASTQKCDLVNVKTVLWKPYDAEKPCWSRNDELLLYARRVAQDLLPTRAPTDLPQLLQYLHIVWEAAARLSPNVTSQRADVIRPAIGDALGGYLQSVALPFATEAYYAGTVDYATIKAFYDLYGKIRVYLDTDGGGWSAACDLSQMATKVEPIDFSSLPTQPDPFSCLKMHIPLKQQAKPKDPNCPDEVASIEVQALETKVEMPMLDDLQMPRALIVPFKTKHLYSILSPNSAQILVEYYDLSMKCIGKTDQATMKNFNAAYFNWLTSYIVPQIQQLKTCPIEWFPGFGGAMRVVDTITRIGLAPSGSKRDYVINQTPTQHSDDKIIKFSNNFKPPKNDDSKSIKSWLPSFNRSVSIPTFNRTNLPTLRLSYFLMPLLVPLLGCLLLYLLYLLYLVCCLPLLACLCCRSGSTCKSGNKQKPLLTLYYRCLESLNGLKPTVDDTPDYDSIAAASGVSARSLASSESEPKSCGMCQWIGTKEKAPETSTKKVVKNKKKRRKGNIDSDASN